jgi:uncharacterized membrane protein YfcA
VFSDPLFLLTAFVAVVLLGLAKGGFSGIGMAATPLLALTMPPLQALAIAFTSTIASAGMPPFSIHVLPQRMEKMRLVGTVTMFFAAVNVLRIFPYFGLGYLTRESLIVSAALMPLAIATNFLGFWLVNRIPTGPFYRITYALMFLISAVLLLQGVAGLLRGWGMLGA